MKLTPRNTPTCVGKTHMKLTPISDTKKHPHVRGEDRLTPDTAIHTRETPPRAWGRRAAWWGSRLLSRNTPTCVGKTWRSALGRFAGQKHPHVRGEDGTHRGLVCCDGETPPRAWGRPIRYGQQPEIERNTPTCVGKTLWPQAQGRGTEKHPHVRGEDGHAAAPRNLEWETPPRAWGRPGWWGEYSGEDGNTPTCVGKTRADQSQRAGPEKHPHVRGEDLVVDLLMDLAVETPPRAWGRPKAGEASPNSVRNTPTCVGKTAAPRVQVSRS